MMLLLQELIMDSASETEVSSLISTPYATPTSKVENQAITQSQPESLKERWAGVQSDLGFEIELVPISGNVSPNIPVRIKFLENPIQNSSGLFQNLSENSLKSNAEMLSDFQTIKKEFQMKTRVKNHQNHTAVLISSQQEKSKQRQNSSENTLQDIVGYTCYKNKHIEILGL